MGMCMGEPEFLKKKIFFLPEMRKMGKCRVFLSLLKIINFS